MAIETSSIITMAAPASISDDWEEVNDDTFSVVSVPTSDDGPGAESSASSPKDSPTLNPDNSFTLPIRSKTTTPSHYDDELGSLDTDVERYGMDSKDVTESDEFPSEALNEILDVDIDPAFLCKVTTSLIKLIQEIVDVIDFNSQAGIGEKHGNSKAIKKECQTLTKHLKSLEPILDGYSKLYSPQRATGDVPLDPGLYEWMSGLRIELLGLQAQLQGHMGQETSSSDQGGNISGESHHDSTLASFSAQMEGFLPIMRADFDEFQTAQMTFLSINDNSESMAEPVTENPRNGRVSNAPPGNNLFHLRRELYELKDQISDCLAEMGKYLCHPVTKDNQGPVPLATIVDSYRSIKSSLEMMLSNHASDWLEYSIAGGLSYNEFCRLNPDTIRSLILQLREVGEDLFLERCKVESIRYMNDPDSVLENDVQLAVKDSSSQTLRTTEEVLASIFRIRKSGDDAPIDDYGRVL